MLKKTKIFILILLIFPLVGYAHPGRTDINGCHTNRKTGDYHCHGKKSVSTSNTARSSTRISTDIDIRTEAKIEARSGEQQKINDCSSDKFNCSDFTFQAEAQAVFEFCGGIDNDVYKLDADNDGFACESLK